MAFSEVNQNFFRLYYVVNEFGTKALNELLRYLVHQTFPSSSASTMMLSQFLALPQVVNDLLFPARTRNFLDPMQKDLLYPSGAPSMTLDYGDLDITLVTTLLKNLTVFSGVLKQPGSCSKTLWTNPTEHDQLFYLLEANVVLLKNKRNSIVHSNEPSMPTEEFEANFDHVKSLVMNIMRMAGSVAFNEDDIEQYRTSPLLPEIFQETAAKLLKSLEATEDLKYEVRILIEQTQIKERKTRNRGVILSLFIVTVVILGLLASNRISADREFEEGVKSREKIEKEVEKLEESLNLKSSTNARRKEFEEGVKSREKIEKELEQLEESLNSKSSTNTKRKDRIGLARVHLKRDNSQDLETRKQKLRDAIKMQPFICSSWKNKDGKMKEEKIEKCVEWLLKGNVHTSFVSLSTSSHEYEPTTFASTRATPKEWIKKEGFHTEYEELVKIHPRKHKKPLKGTIGLTLKSKQLYLNDYVKGTPEMCTNEMHNLSKNEL
ncbi:uncharacterized protein LOC116300174 [Actinia tenebrosa]|uniref:Uncharacterized protein LOC116300174 n=1 Tax=Actinia tenebrosa TaxID=6105 RepID=A0A6P8IEW0_ACTTE|nr:uncharacterized protein LOC116300174 [Actinia tenebrosa]